MDAKRTQVIAQIAMIKFEKTRERPTALVSVFFVSLFVARTRRMQ